MSTMLVESRAAHRAWWSTVRARLLQRPEMSMEELALAASLFFTIACNGSFFRAVSASGVLDEASGSLTGASLVVLITALHMILMLAVLTRRTAKPLLGALFLVTAIAVHFMTRYTVFLDADMVGNIVHTDRKESAELLSWSLAPSLLLLGVLPSLAVWRVRIRRRPIVRALVVRLASLALATVIALVAALASYPSLSSLMRNHREMRHLVTPGNYVVALYHVLRLDNAVRDAPRTPIGLGAGVVGRPAGAKPRLLVLVVGETVRAQNWGLNGYARQTTPRLSSRDLVNFADMHSCGTATEVSLPCMFSPLGRADYDKDRVKHSESLLHVLDHAGIATLWRDNQTGCKGVCDGLPFESFEHAADPEHCNDEGCLDGVLLAGLDKAVDEHRGDVVVVLHPLGNHGPSYFKRYPQRLATFQPACESSDLGHCRREEIVNAYDNAILATDELLDRVITFLSAQTSRDTALIYVSDHGESLGENGLYLHGMPYAIAPETQTRVPMVMWFSPGMRASRGIDGDCMRALANGTASHDNVFHSVLGLMQVKAPEFDPGLDLIGACARLATTEGGVNDASRKPPIGGERRASAAGMAVIE
jgi:lipid A ethanolaminephosphotransferase